MAADTEPDLRPLNPCGKPGAVGLFVPRNGRAQTALLQVQRQILPASEGMKQSGRARPLRPSSRLRDPALRWYTGVHQGFCQISLPPCSVHNRSLSNPVGCLYSRLALWVLLIAPSLSKGDYKHLLDSSNLPLSCGQVNLTSVE